jgi:hypothetical protein
MLADDDVTDPALTPLITGATTGLFTVTVIPLAVAVFPTVSVASAVNVWVVLVADVVSQDTAYPGPAPVTALPRFAPSNWNCTDDTPALSVAFADTVTLPLTVAPGAGAVIVTTGGVVSITMAGPVTVKPPITSSDTS